MQKYFLFLLIILIIPLVSANNVTRSFAFNQTSYELTISLNISVDPEDKTYVIQEVVPSDLVIMDSGGVDSQNNILQIAKFSQGDVINGIKNYKVKVLINKTYLFRGIYAFSTTGALERNISGETTFVLISSGDSDSDGVNDSEDLCTGGSMLARDINRYGCPKPIDTNFDIKPNFNDTNLFNVSNFEIGITRFGKIHFNQNVSLLRRSNGVYSPVDLDSTINISGNHVEVNSSAFSELNVSASITLFNIIFTNPFIKRDGVNCTDCVITYWNSSEGKIIFNVPHFTSYEVGESDITLPYCGDGRRDAGETCSNCVADVGTCPVNPGNGNSGANTNNICNPSWNCYWSICQDNIERKVCTDNNHCGTTRNKPNEGFRPCLINVECIDNDNDGYGQGSGCLGIDLNDNDPAVTATPVQALNNQETTFMDKLNSFISEAKAYFSSGENAKIIKIILTILVVVIVLIILILVVRAYKKNKYLSFKKERIAQAKLAVQKWRQQDWRDEVIKQKFREKGWKEEDIARVMS